MQLPQFKNQKIRRNYTALSFLLPFSLLAVMFFICSVTPFGSNTLLYSDNFHQYYPFFRQFRESIRSGAGLQWTWSVGSGMDYLGMISYYLASPLNWLSILLPESWTLTYFTWLMPIKLSLASLFFAILLKNLFGKDDLSLPLFGAFYGLCAWALGYQWNVMWLDSFALLPLVVLGTIRLLTERKYLLYTLCLALSVMVNYYIGFFVCIFVFLVFCCYEICRFKTIGRFFADLFFMGVFTVLALGMTAVLEIPTLASLQTTNSSINQFPEGFQLNIVSSEAQTAAKEAWSAYKTAKEGGEGTFALWFAAMKAAVPAVFSGMRQVAGQIGGGQTPTYIDGLPNLYCGVFPIALGFLFLLSKDVKLRDKLCAVGLLTLFLLSFLFRQLDYIWHGFHFTNQIPYRFSFLFSFVVLYMAYRAFLLRSGFSLWQILVSGVCSLLLLLFGGHSGSDVLYWIFNLIFLVLYLLCMVVGHPDSPLLRRAPAPVSEPEDEEAPAPLPAERAGQYARFACAMTAAIMTVELILHAVFFIGGFSVTDYDYPKHEDDAVALFEKLESMDDALFYRTEVTHSQTLNDGALNGYNGISTFSSSANVKMTEFMQCLGAGARGSYNRYCYEESSPVSNLFLNLKYLVERNGEVDGNAYFDVLFAENGMTVLQNNAYLPLGFLAESELADLEFSTDNRSFAFQNQLFRAATGLSGSVWTSVRHADFSYAATGDVEISKTNGCYVKFSTGSEGGQLTITYTIDQAGFLCLDLNLYKQKNFVVYRNDEKLYSDTYSLPQMLAVGDVAPGDSVKLVITCKPNFSSTSLTADAYILNEELYRQGYDILSRSTLELTEFDTTYLRGNISCDRAGLLYTSIPQNGNVVTAVDEQGEKYSTVTGQGNWKVYVDGQEAEITLVGDCMIGVYLTEGDHVVEFRYENGALKSGAKITLLCAGVFGLIVLADQLRKRKKKAQ